MTIFADSFLETGAAISLPSHTPTGANAGASWVLQIASGVAQVIGSSGSQVWDNNNSNGNWFRMSDSLGSDVHSVQAVGVGGVVGGGSPVAIGVRGRCSTTLGDAGIQFYYNWNDQQFHLYVNGADTASGVVAWAAGNKTLLLECRASDFRGYVDGVLTCQYTAADSNAGGFYGGIVLSNTGAVVGAARMASYTSAPIVGGGGSVPTITSITPDNGYQNSTQPIVIVGTNLTGAVVTYDGTGVSASGTVVNSSTNVSSNAVITGAAAATARTLTVTTSGGTATATFTVRDRTAVAGSTAYSRIHLGM